jgi:radical SAM superfamily enzyme YgiQ (UPF0313 family)
MNNHPIVFVAFTQSDNLGVGYLVSALSEAGYQSLIIDFQSGKEEILKTLKRIKPLVMGFSVIFQYHIYEFKKLINYLRESGITSHFTAGGQYASMRYADLFKLIPSLNSIVRFEGEYTFLELVNCIYSGVDWQEIKGLAYKRNGKIIANPLRPPEMDLDKFPFPMRLSFKEYALDKQFATLIASRGCLNNCSFCNNREYIKQSSVFFKRIRKPEKVVSEMQFLHYKMDCSVFLFEDDDFPVKAEKGSDWIERFCYELKRKKLVDKIMWKINCRPDEIDYKRFTLMKDHGLYLVFLGIDDGTNIGLTRLNKHMTIKETLKGIDILKRVEIGFDYGFMLFQPASTFRSIYDNLEFLEQLCGDGYTPVTFLKLKPYFDTRVEKELREEGRLVGKPGFLDYDFLNNSLNHYYSFIRDSFMEWLNDPDGFVNISKWARNYLSVFSHFFKITPNVQSLSAEVKKSIANGNLFFLDTMKELAIIFESGKYDQGKNGALTSYRKNIVKNHAQFKEQISNSIDKIWRLAEYQKLLQLIKY